MIQQYDSLICQVKELFEVLSSKKCDPSAAWKTLPQEELILKSDAAFELGGNGAYAISGIFFTTNLTMGTEINILTAGTGSVVTVCDEVFNSPDKFDTDSSINYAKFVIIRLKKEAVENKDSQQLYALFRKLEYVRFHAFLDGFSIRISSSQHKEVSRVSKKAVKQGISLSSIAQTFVEAYSEIPEVAAVQIYIAAKQKSDADTEVFSKLEKLVLKSEEITDSLNVIFKGLKMDCSTCGQKELCDEIEGMKDLHKSML